VLQILKVNNRKELPTMIIPQKIYDEIELIQLILNNPYDSDIEKILAIRRVVERLLNN
jgi:hypothetical protein